MITPWNTITNDFNPQFEEFVTRICHVNHIKISKKMKKFLKKCYDINVISGRPFDFMDFKPLKVDTVRKRVNRLKPFIEPVIRSNHTNHKLRGFSLPRYVTKNSRGVIPNTVDPEFDRMLSEIKRQPLKMHDLRLEAKIAELYENLEEFTDFVPNSKNKAFTIDLSSGERFDVKVNVYRNGKMQIMVGCTQNPLGYDLWGFLELVRLLGYACCRLKGITERNFQHNPIPDWIVQYLHINQDGLEINGKHFSYSINDLANHSVFYLKKFGDSQWKPRFEKHERPNKSIQEITETM